jgi:hypothetical protein
MSAGDSSLNSLSPETDEVCSRNRGAAASGRSPLQKATPRYAIHASCKTLVLGLFIQSMRRSPGVPRPNTIH